MDLFQVIFPGRKEPLLMKTVSKVLPPQVGIIRYLFIFISIQLTKYRNIFPCWTLISNVHSTLMNANVCVTLVFSIFSCQLGTTMLVSPNFIFDIFCVFFLYFVFQFLSPVGCSQAGRPKGWEGGRRKGKRKRGEGKMRTMKLKQKWPCMIWNIGYCAEHI